MILLTIILALATVYYRVSLAPIQRDSWFVAWLHRVAGWPVVGAIPAVRLVLTVMLPVMGLVLLLDLLKGTPAILLLAIDVLVLLYSFGRGDLQGQLNTLQNDLQRGDSQAAFHIGAALSADKSDIVAFDLPALSQALRQRIAYAYFERYLAVIFWSLAGGVAGALLYRLSVLYRVSLSQPVVIGSGLTGFLQVRTAGRWLALLEWLPVGLAGFTLSLVGQFGAGLSRWVARWFSGRSSAKVLGDYVDDALDYPGDTELTSNTDIAASCGQIQALFKRVLVFWLCLLALALVL